MNPLDVLTHLAAFIAGAATVRYLTRHYVKAVDVDGHTALELTGGDTTVHTPLRYGWILLVAALVLIGIGVQTWLAAEDNTARDRRDRAYADCLTEFATDLVTTIERRTAATQALERAKAQRDTATDRVIRIVVLARRIPPEANERQFDRALEAQLLAQQEFREVSRETATVRRVNQYVLPNAVCPRS